MLGAGRGGGSKNQWETRPGASTEPGRAVFPGLRKYRMHFPISALSAGFSPFRGLGCPASQARHKTITIRACEAAHTIGNNFQGKGTLLGRPYLPISVSSGFNNGL